MLALKSHTFSSLKQQAGIGPVEGEIVFWTRQSYSPLFYRNKGKSPNHSLALIKFNSINLVVPRYLANVSFSTYPDVSNIFSIAAGMTQSKLSESLLEAEPMLAKISRIIWASEWFREYDFPLLPNSSQFPAPTSTFSA